MKRHKRIPVPGQRILRSIVAVWLCFAVYLLRGRCGLVLFSAIAVLQGIQPYTKDMKAIARRRVFGTVIGAAWGLLMLLIEIVLIGEGIPDEIPHYLMVGLFTGLVIYSTVLLKITDMAYFSAVVFLSVAVSHAGDADPYLYAFNRLLDTVIGVGLAEFVNRIQLPRAKHTDTLFVSAMGHTLLDEEKRLSPYAKVELNRLIEDGAKFTVATSVSQATVRELLSGVDLRYPIITLNGAALYDMQRMEYLRVKYMTPAQAETVIRWAREYELPFFCSIIQDNLLVIRYNELENEAMRQMFERRRRSPYRNFVKTPADAYEDVVYLMALDKTERIEAAYAALQRQPWIGDYRVARDRFEPEGWSVLRIYDASVSREAMLRELEALMQTEKTVTFGRDPQRWDVCIEGDNRDLVVKALRDRFEPVDFRCWRSIFRT